MMNRQSDELLLGERVNYVKYRISALCSLSTLLLQTSLLVSCSDKGLLHSKNNLKPLA